MKKLVPSGLAILFVLISLAMSPVHGSGSFPDTPRGDERATLSGERLSAWQEIIARDPSVVDDESLTFLDRLALHHMSSEQAAAVAQGTPSAEIILSNGQSLEDFLRASAGTHRLYQFRSVGSRKCLEVADSSSSSLVKQYSCRNYNVQKFSVYPLQGGYFALISINGKCLDVKGGSQVNRAFVQQFPCHYGPNQQWTLTLPQEGQVFNPSTTVVARHSGKCLDVRGASSENNARIQQFSCHGGLNQAWFLRRVFLYD